MFATVLTTIATIWRPGLSKILTGILQHGISLRFKFTEINSLGQRLKKTDH